MHACTGTKASLGQGARRDSRGRAGAVLQVGSAGGSGVLDLDGQC